MQEKQLKLNLSKSEELCWFLQSVQIPSPTDLGRELSTITCFGPGMFLLGSEPL